MRKHAPGMDAALFNELVGDMLAACGAEDPPGDIVPSGRTHVDFSPAVKPRPAAAGISATPGRGKSANAKRTSQRGKGVRAVGAPPVEAESPEAGSSPRGNPTAAGPTTPGTVASTKPKGVSLCNHGSSCPRYGSLDVCPDWHEPEDAAAIRQRLGKNFISPTAAYKKLLAASEHANQALSRAAAVHEADQPRLARVQPTPEVPSGLFSSPPGPEAVRQHLEKLMALVRGAGSSDDAPAVAAVPGAPAGHFTWGQAAQFIADARHDCMSRTSAMAAVSLPPVLPSPACALLPLPVLPASMPASVPQTSSSSLHSSVQSHAPATVSIPGPALRFGGFACCNECDAPFLSPTAGLCDGCTARRSAIENSPATQDWYEGLLPTIGVARSVREHRQSERVSPLSDVREHTGATRKSRGPRCERASAVPPNKGRAAYGRHFLCTCRCRCGRGT
jgi:hypothetical protein